MERSFNSRILYVISPGWPKDDAAGFIEATETLERFSYGVTMIAPGEVAMLSSSATGYFQSEANLIKEVTKALTDLLLRPVNVGIGNGLFAARLAALHSAIIPQDKIQEFLAPLSVRYLPDKQIADFLLKLGIKTLGEFGAIGEGMILERLGLSGKWCHDLAKGKLYDLNFQQKERAFTRHIIFDPPSFSYEQILFNVKQLSESFIDSIAKQGLLVTSILLKINFDDSQNAERLWYSNSFFNKRNLVDRVRWFLEILQPTGAIEQIEFTAKDIVSNGYFQDNLSFEQVKENPRLDKALEHIEVLLGTDRIYKSIIKPGRRPACDRGKIFYDSKVEIPYIKSGFRTDELTEDGAIFYESLTDQEVFLPIDKLSRPWPSNIPTFHPGIFYEDPVEIDIFNKNAIKVSVNHKALMSDTPYFIVATKFKKKISSCFGPWPISEFWWDESKFKRFAYLQLITEDEIALLVYSFKQQWYLAGIYD